MVFSNDTLLARYNKRAADAGGSRPQPRQKKPKVTSDPPRGERPPSEAGNAAQEKRKSKDPQSAGASDRVAQEPAARARPAPSSQRGRQVVRLRRSGPEPGSGLGVPSSSRSRPPSSSGAHPPSSSGSEPRPDRRPYNPEWLLFEDDRAISDGCAAREVVRCAMLPADRAQLEKVGIDEFVDQAYCSAVRHLHEIDMLVSAAANYQDRAWEGEKKAEAAEKKMKEAEARAKEAEIKAEAAESRLKDVTERLHEEEGEHALSRSALRGAEARLSDLTSELAGKKYENSVFRVKLDQLELREKKTEERIRQAVQSFRQSAEFQDELAEEAVDGLIRGFEDFRAQAQKLCPEVDFSSLQPLLADIAGEEVEAESGPEVTPAAVVEISPEPAREVVSDPASEVASIVAAEPAEAAEAPAEVVREVTSEAASEPTPDVALGA